MAQQLDLQEQVDALKAFWAQWGNLIIWVATIILAAFAGWNFWLKHERDLSAQASTLYGEMEVAAQSGDATRAATIFGDMKKLVPKTAYAQQAALLAAKVENEKGKTADAMAALQWVADNGNEENAAVARLRLAGLLADGKKPEDALKQLDQVKPASFAPLVADRRGDILLAKGDREGAKTAYKAAFEALPATQQYRFVVEAKLTALGAAPAISAASAAAAAAPTGAGE